MAIIPVNPLVAIVGAGPAGLTAAYRLGVSGVPALVFERDPYHVGGISRTVDYRGYGFDLGGHRFFTRSREIEQLWAEMLPGGMLDRPRQSRIFYKGRFFSYPLKPLDALAKLGIWESLRCVGSYAQASLFPTPEPQSFEAWTVNRFGRRLYEIFFRAYTEKVWGIPCSQISADWAAQRIQDLSLSSALRNAVLPARNGRPKTLIDSFQYPRRGPGMLWEACAQRVREMGGTIRMGCEVVGCRWEAEAGEWVVRYRQEGRACEVRAGHLISSAPLRELIPELEPALPEKAMAAARALGYRDFLTVALILKDRDLFPDNWIYVHDPAVRVGRIQNYKSWSPYMVADPEHCSCGMEYFCFEGDELWNAPDKDLIAMACREMEHLGLARAADLIDGCVLRQRKAYPVYDRGYAGNIAVLRQELERAFPTLHLAGRNGMHRYNNMDHSMLTALCAAENILAGRRIRDPWDINPDSL